MCELLNPMVFGILDDMRQEIIGTGFFVTIDGVALTANHVIEDYTFEDKIPIKFFDESDNEELNASILYREPETDAALLWIPKYLNDTIPSCKTEFIRGSEYLILGFHRQYIFEGPVPCRLKIAEDIPVRKVKFIDESTMDCLVLFPNREADTIQPAMSGAPVMDVIDNKIVGITTGTSKHLVETERLIEIADALIPGDEGFASPFDRVFFGAQPFRTLVNSKCGSLKEVLQQFNYQEQWENIECHSLNWSLMDSLRSKFKAPIFKLDIHRTSKSPDGIILENLKNIFIPIPPYPSKSNYFLLQRLITREEYFLFLSENPYWQKKVTCQIDRKVDEDYLKNWNPNQMPSNNLYFTINYISYYAAKAFIEWLSHKTRKIMRFLTVQEWEQVAKAGRNENWVEDELKKLRVNYDNIVGYPTAPSYSLPNPYGVSDTLGNLKEICVENIESKHQNIYACGGSFDSIAELLTSKVEIKRNVCRGDVGFRVVMDV